MKLSAVTLQFNRKGNCHYTDRIAWLALNTLCTIGAWQWICQRYHYYVTRYVTEHIRYICIWMSGFVYTNVYSLFIGSHSHRVQAVSCSAVCALYDSLLRVSQLLHVQTALYTILLIEPPTLGADWSISFSTTATQLCHYIYEYGGSVGS